MFLKNDVYIHVAILILLFLLFYFFFSLSGMSRRSNARAKTPPPRLPVPSKSRLFGEGMAKESRTSHIPIIILIMYSTIGLLLLFF